MNWLSILLVLSVLDWSYGYRADAPPVLVDFYVMSKCPYATDFELDFQKHVLSYSGLPQITNLRVNFIASVDPSQPSGFDSMHGQTEVWGDINELCAYNLSNPSPNNYKWYNFLLCLDQNGDEIPDNAEDCANQVGLDYSTIQNCVNSDLGKALMTESIAKTDHFGVDESPTIYINNQFYCVWTGSPCKAQTLDDFRTAICQVYTGTQPAGCNQ
jgi:hypothetical protein